MLSMRNFYLSSTQLKSQQYRYTRVSRARVVKIWAVQWLGLVQTSWNVTFSNMSRAAHNMASISL